MKTRRGVLAALVALPLLLAAGGPPAAPPEPGEAQMTQAAQDAQKAATRALMQGVILSLRTAFLSSMSEKQYQAPAQRKEILAALQSLAANAGYLENHGQELNQSYDFLRRSLADDAREVARRYEEGEYESSRFVLHQIAENCFACHSRLPSNKEYSLGESFLKDAEMERLPLEEQVRLSVATRQFDTALATCEKIFRSSDISASEIDLIGTFEDYLKISIRVRTDYSRAISALEQFAQRSDVHAYLRVNIESWIESLRELGGAPPKGNELGRAKKLIKRGQLRNRFPADRRGLVYFVAASGLLHRYVDRSPDRGRALAEPYYLLGVAESYIGNSFWVSETEFFLETSIRLAPDAPVAMQAYEFLEEFTVQEFTGSSGIDLPDDVRKHLRELHDLIENAEAPKEASAAASLA